MLRTDSEKGQVDEKSFCSRHEDELGEMVMVSCYQWAEPLSSLVYPLSAANL